MKPISNTPVGFHIKNLDVLGLDQEPNLGGTKGGASELARAPLLSSLGTHTAQPDQQPKLDGNIALAAPNTLLSRKPPTSSRQSNTPNPSAYPWWPI